MRKPRIINSFVKFSDADLEQKAELIISSLKDNTHYPTPSPPLTELQAATDAFDLAITKAKEGGKVEKLERDNKRKELVDLLRKLALYVQMEGDGDDVALASSGFSLSKAPQPIGILPKPQRFTVIPKTPGIVTLTLKTIYGAKTYQYEFRPKGEEKWLVQAETKPTLLLTNLESGIEYEFRVTGIGSNPQRIYSDVISSFVL